MMIPQSITEKKDWKEMMLYVLLKYIDRHYLYYKQVFVPVKNTYCRRCGYYYVDLYRPDCVMQYAYSTSNEKLIKRYMRKMIRQDILRLIEYTIDNHLSTETIIVNFNHKNKFETATSKYFIDDLELEKLFNIQGKRQVKLFSKQIERHFKEAMKNSRENQ